jgi:hypothetical protein
MIEMQTHSPRRALPRTGLSLAQALNIHLDVFKSVRVDADARRISQALTVPEYIETWISIPGAESGSVTLASPEDSGFRLDHFSVHRSPLTVTGSFLFCHLRKIRLLWRKASDDLCADSVVDIRVRGNFGSSVVELRHTGLASLDEYVWHEALWRRSLEKLAALIRS